jgi:hypothetical protein
VKRRFFNAIAVVSAVLCVGTAALWVRTNAGGWSFSSDTLFRIDIWMSPDGSIIDIGGTRGWGDSYHREDYPFPFWQLFLLFLVLPARWVQLEHRRRVKSRVGVCSECGYDLRATPERCPECGAIPPSRA